MKANLMIGDWVMVYNAPAKVMYIKSGIMLEDRKGGTCFENAEDLDPIPITDKIMEMNFGKPSDYDIYSQDGVSIGETLNGSWVVKCGYDCLHVRFVHELQQALRLMGKNKDIEL